MMDRLSCSRLLHLPEIHHAQFEHTQPTTTEVFDIDNEHALPEFQYELGALPDFTPLAFFAIDYLTLVSKNKQHRRMYMQN